MKILENAGTVSGVNISAITLKNLKKVLSSTLKNETKNFCIIHTINPEIVMEAHRNSSYKNALNSGTYNVVDGFGLFVALNTRGIKIKDRICGSDIVYDILAEADKNKCKVLLLGGASARLNLAMGSVMDMYKNIKIYGISPPYSDALPLKNQMEICDLLKKEMPEVVLVCLGAPKQEFWIKDNKDLLRECGVKVVAGLGGTVDFLSGEISRAPIFIRKIGCEWLYRLVKEPKRIKRQMRSLPIFFAKAVFQRKFIVSHE